MKQLGSKQWQRKTQSLLASLIYRLAQGPVETEPFTASLKQIYSDRIAANPLNTDVLKNSLGQVKLGKLSRTKKTKEEIHAFYKTPTPEK